MARCVLKFKDVEIKTYPFNKESMTIGRSEDNDIVVSNMAVSGYHAKIDLVGNNFFLTDLQSMNGTYVNNHRIVSCKLSDHDIITVGKHVIDFSMDEGEQQKSRSSNEFDQTMFLDTRKAKELRSEDQGTRQTGKISPSTQKKARVAVLSFLSGGEGEFPLKKKLTKIGKDKNCDIVVHGMFVGSTAATLSLRPSGYAITFAGGISKLKVNNKVIKGSVLLKEFDMIEIGSAKMQFYLK